MMIHFSIRSLALLFCSSFLALAPAAFAVDGVTLINQNTSVNGLPGCPHAGFPIILCAPGSYRLSGDLRVPDANTNAINIAANDITLDLNGFSIVGPVTCQAGTYPVVCSTSGSGMGVSAFAGDTHPRNTTVRNGNIRGMGQYGIFLLRAGSLVEGVHVEWTGNAGGAGIYVISGVVIHCSADTNAGTGIVGADVINSSTAAYNGGYGFDGGFSVSDSVASNNGQDGIHNAFLAVNNTSTFNIGLGLRFDGNGYGYLGNVMYGNNNFGSQVSTLGTSLGHNLCDSVGC